MSGSNSQERPALIEAPTIEDTLRRVEQYIKFWKDEMTHCQVNVLKHVALGQLNHTKRRLQAILKAEGKS